MDKDNVLDYRLFDGDDDAETVAYKQILNGVISQTLPPAEAARQMDEWVTQEAVSRLTKFEDRNPPLSLSDEEMDNIHLVAPNPSRHMDMMIGSIARVSSACPPGHPSQTRLVEFLQALKELPRHEVPNVSYDENHAPVWGTKVIWPFGTEASEFFVPLFQREATDLAYPYSDVETPGSESQIRWRNLQSFMAQLTTLDLIDCRSASALNYILPSFYAYPDLDQRGQDGTRRIAADLEAAAQWLLPDDARTWVRRRCMENAGELWTEGNWDIWRQQLAFFANDERFPAATRALAAAIQAKIEGSRADQRCNDN
ncbi:hypothetical protein AAL_05451 [Moelleriella libera RCEF 2490]|uniref:Uncharacterized protein n=1 Tax=Moelleriella libera RCEF 2490 TaxID=1081109 RepID=A0A168ABW3_9HYPO|nr:hypothetical protein AAL_05451 [Moelleriella libera RCEF 2490]